MLLTISNETNAVLQFITVLFIFLFVLGITYVTTRWIANFQKQRVNSNNIEVIETYRLSPNKFIQIVRIGDKYLALAISKDKVTTLTELTKEQLDIKALGENEMLDFKQVLDKVKSFKQKK